MKNIIKKRIKELPKEFSEIADRFALDYLITQQLHFKTLVNIDVCKFPLSLIGSIPKEEKQTIFDKILDRVIDNDKILNNLLKKAKIDKLSIKKD